MGIVGELDIVEAILNGVDAIVVVDGVVGVSMRGCCACSCGTSNFVGFCEVLLELWPCFVGIVESVSF